MGGVGVCVCVGGRVCMRVCRVVEERVVVVVVVIIVTKQQ